MKKELLISALVLSMSFTATAVYYPNASDSQIDTEGPQAKTLEADDVDSYSLEKDKTEVTGAETETRTSAGFIQGILNTVRGFF